MNSYSSRVAPLFSGKFILIASIVVLLGGCFVFYTAVFAASSDEIIINEFSPNSNPEWVELRNTTESIVDLSGWKLTELTTPQGTPREVDLLALSGTIPAGGVLAFDVGTSRLNNGGDSIGLYDDTDVLMQRVTYGTVNGYPRTGGLETSPASGQSGMFDGAGWVIFGNSFNKGWFNDAGQEGRAPLLSDIDASLESAGITSNIGELNNPSDTPTAEPGALYFEKSGKGRITFTASLNLSDQAAVAILQSLGTAMEMSDGHIRFDSETAAAIAATGAKIYMYGLDALGYTRTPDIIIKDDAGNAVGIANDPEAIGGINYDTETGELSFTALHFTQFDLGHLAAITSVAPTDITPEVGDDFLPQIGAALARGSDAYIGRTTTYTGSAIGLGDPENGVPETIKWKITIDGPSNLMQSMVDLDEVGVLDTPSTEANVATYHYPLFEVGDEEVQLVATGSCNVAEEDLDPESDTLHDDDCDTEVGFSLDENDEFINADKIRFNQNAPTGSYAITYELVNTANGLVLGKQEIEVNVIDTTAPTVTKMGDDSADVSIDAGDTYLAFSEVLSDDAKASVTNALAAGADRALSYYWDGNQLIITASETTTFADDVMANVSDIDGNAAVLLLIDSKLADTQIAPDSDTGAATADTTTPQIVITNPTQAVNVTISSGTVDPTIDVSAFIAGGTGTLPQITITALNAGNANVSIPASTVVTSASSTWNGIIAAPTAATVTLPETVGEIKTLSTAIEVGFAGEKLSFNKAIRLLIPGQAGKRAGYVRTGIAFTEITNACAADNQTAGDALAADGDCKIDVASDLVIWTKHFTAFAAYTQTTNPPASPAPVVSGGGGGIVGLITSAVAPTIAPQAKTTARATIAQPQGRVLGAAVYNFTQNLGIDARGDDVAELQKILISGGYLKISSPTGYFGAATREAVKAYQQANGLETTGIIGPKTRAFLNRVVSGMDNETRAAFIRQLQSQFQALLRRMQDLQETRGR